jgi:L-asparaginase
MEDAKTEDTKVEDVKPNGAKPKKKVLMLCTGGTIGMLPKDANDPKSPLVPASWEKIKANLVALNKLEFAVRVQEMQLIDSSDMHPGYWIDIAQEIKKAYNDYDGFVILHGTDTMSYTATALSFLLENLGKPVIVTGSQLPLAEPRTDAAVNLVTALVLAASDGVPTVPEVCILFNNVLIRGNRSRKISSSGFAGFSSPNYGLLAEIGEHISINTKLLRKATSEGFFINQDLDKSVMVFDVFPGISPKILRSVFAIENLKGVVLRTYGTGNAPTDKALLKEIDRAISERKLAIVNITQCTQGMVEMGLYDASVGLSRIGVISGVDMTPEAALVKMMFLLEQYKDDIEMVKEQMQKNLRGEQSVNVFNLTYEPKDADSEQVFRLKAKSLSAGCVKEDITKANIRFDEIKTDAQDEKVRLAVFMNYPSADLETDTDIPQCLGIIESKNDGEESEAHLMLECTEKVRQVIDPNRPVQLTAVSYNGNVTWDSVFFSVYTDAID